MHSTATMNKEATEPGPLSLSDVLEGLIVERGYRNMDQSHASDLDGTTVKCQGEQVVLAGDIPPGCIGSVYSQELWGLAIKAEKAGDSHFAQQLTLSAATCGARGNAEAFQRHFGLDRGPADETVDLRQTVHAISVMALAQILDANGDADKAELVRKINAACIAGIVRNIRDGVAARDALTLTAASK